jgi:outer membrane protein assembly factor BamB
VLVQDGVAYLTAGRSSYLDGGIDLCRADPNTGKLMSRTPIYSPDPRTGRQPPHSAPAVMPGARSDILSGDGGHVYLRDMVFDPQGHLLPQGDPHLLTLTDFLDHSWPHRSYWIFGTRCSVSGGCSARDKNLLYGRLLVFNESTVYGYARASVHWSDQFQDGPYRLFSRKRGQTTNDWTTTLPIQVRAMVLADKTLFVAGPSIARATEGERASSARLLALSAADGRLLDEFRLDGPPLVDGLAAAGGRLYVSLEDGRVVCMAKSH